MTDYPSAPSGSAAEATFKSLERLGVAYAGSTSEGGRFRCANPGHDDDRPSMDVTIGYKGKPLFNCKPCEQAMGQKEFIDALRAAGVRWSGDPCKVEDIEWGEPAAVERIRVAKSGGKGDVALSHVYTYLDAFGEPVFKVCRYDPTPGSEARKQFRPSRWEHGWHVGLEGVERVPYHLDQFEEWAGGVLYLVEGEKAADALVDIGKAATTFHGGAAGKVEDDWPTRYGFDRFTQVRVWPDADEAGVVRARQLIADLHSAGVKAVAYGVTADLVEPKDDVFDVLARGDQRKARALDDAALDALAALHPMPRRAVAAVTPQEPLLGPVVGGKQLVSAVPAFDAPGAGSGVLAGPYKVNVNTEPYEFAKEIVARHFTDAEGVLTLRFRHDDRTFWLWNSEAGRYRHLSDDDVKALVARILADAEETTDDGTVRPVKVKARTYGEVVEVLRIITLTSEYGGGSLLPSVGGIPFLNGWLDASTGELLPLGPARDIRWSVPVDYDAEAKCPGWMRFLKSCGFERGTDEYRLLRQWFGYLLSGSKKHEKALLLIGQSRAGKGVTIRIAEALLGGEAGGATATSLDSLMGNFGLQSFIGKGLATIPDARFGRSDKGLNARLLSLTSNDSLPVDVKYGKPLSLNLGVRVMIGTNETPNFIEASDALARRFLIIKFGVSHADNPDTGLFDRLRRELPGIARWALGGLRDLEEEGRFVETETGKEIQEQMIMYGSFIRLFVEECCDLVPGAITTNETLCRVFNGWAEDNRVHPQSSARIAMMLNDAFPGAIGNGRKKVGGTVKRAKTGISIKKEFAVYE